MTPAPDGAVTLTLNTVSGKLHLRRRCAGPDQRFHFPFEARAGEELVGFLYLKFTGICRKCCR